MEEWFGIIAGRFDTNVILIFNFGIWLFFDLTQIKKMKPILSILIGLGLSVAYVYFYDEWLSVGAEDVVNVPNVINSFLLSSFLYSIGLKYIFEYISNNKKVIGQAIVNFFIKFIKARFK